MNKNKWFLNGGRGSGRSFRLLCETYENKIAELEKENAELKKEWQEQVQKATDEGYARTLQTIQLSKAKELLKKWVELFKPKGGNIPPTPIQVDTEQFLSEVEK